jgi:hypothetical protein
MKANANPFDQLAARVEALEERVRALEGSWHEPAQAAASSAVAEAQASTWPEPLPQFTSLFPVFGSALLGIAGAYLLRAISGANLLPRTLVALIAAAYAGAWLLAAAKMGPRKIAGVLYAAVSILVLGPMLWEMTVRFGAMSGTVACLILAMYAAEACVIAFSRNQAHVFSIAFAGSAIAALALSIATHRMAEFTFLLLAMLLLCELGDRKLEIRGIRILVALAADAGVWTLLLIYRLAPANRPDYPRLNLTLVLLSAVLLFAVEMAAIARQVLARGVPVPAFRAAQAMIAFALLAAALIWLMPHSARTILGVGCGTLSAACYGAAYGPVRRGPHRRNFLLLSIWAACLFLGAVFTLASLAVGSVVLGIAAVAAIMLANRLASNLLELQGVVFLLVAAAESGLLVWAARALAGSPPGMPGRAAAAGVICIVLAYVAGRERAGEEWPKQSLHLVTAVAAAFAVAAILVEAFLRLARLFLLPEAFHLALIRSLAICLVALGSALVGSRAAKPAMVRTAYTALAFVAAKLAFEDLRHGHMEYIAGSIFAVALTLIAVPRLAARKVGDRQTPGSRVHD